MASTIMPRAPLPLSGFISAVGKAPTKPASPPQALTTAAMPSVNKSMAPEARNTPMPTKMATK